MGLEFDPCCGRDTLGVEMRRQLLLSFPFHYVIWDRAIFIYSGLEGGGLLLLALAVREVNMLFCNSSQSDQFLPQ